jgi:outer membrane receptor protein involved in Fe transport
MQSLRFVFLFSLIGIFGISAGQAVGQSIEGTVTDEDGAPVPFAIVVIQGTYVGASADANGEYTISNVPEGSHTLKASAVGYRAKAADVPVSSGQTVTQDFTLATDLLNLEGIVVTGTRSPRAKLESTTAISTLSPRELEQAAPRSTTEVLRYIPGFTRVESSGGEVNQNVSVRGIYGVELVAFMEDGMPVFPTMHTFFMNADNLFRPDENIATVEVVRGGNSALFSSSTPGAVVNFINKTGGPEISGILRVTGGTGGIVRYDANINGPLGEDYRFNLGGFYRYDRGVRDPGFPGIRGGQLKASVTRLLKKGYVRASLKLIDDRNQFILPLPFQNPSDPDYVDGFSDFGSMNTIEANGLRVPLPFENGDLEIPLDDGIRTKASWLTAEISFDLPGDWNLHNTAQVMQNDQSWNALVPFDVVRSDDAVTNYLETFFGTRYQSFLQSQGILPDSVGGEPVEFTSIEALGTQSRLFFANHFDALGNKLPFDTPNGLLAPSGLFHVEKPMSAFSDQLVVTKKVEEHTFTVGSYFANYSMENRWFQPAILTDVRDNPRVVDGIVDTTSLKYKWEHPTTGVEDSVTVGIGNIAVTNNGFFDFGGKSASGRGQVSIISVFGSAELQATDRLRIDIGGRFERNHFYQVSENTERTDLDGDPKTVYDITSWGNRTFRQFDFTFNEWAASAGANYSVSDEMSVYVQGSHGFKMPALDEYLFPATAQAVLFEPRKTETVEGGVKYSSSKLGASVVGFWGQLRDIFTQASEIDPVTGGTVWVILTEPKTRSYGAEIEVSASPTPGLRFLGSGTIIEAELGSGADLGSVLAGVPSVLANLSGTYTESGLSLLADLHYVGSRFVSTQVAGAADTDLDAYSYLNLGASYTFPGQAVTLSANLLNVYQSKGLEEGNPRLRQVGGRTSDIFLARPILPRRFTLSLGYRF